MVESISGRLFSNLDILCHNFSLFLRKRHEAIDFTFLSLYVLLQLILIVFIYLFENYIGIVVGGFIILFLFLISSERIVLQFKSKQAQGDTDNLEKKYYELKTETKLLRERNKELISRMEFWIESFKKTNK